MGLHTVIHKLFFPKLKVKPKQSWKDNLAELGKVENLNILRNSKRISAVSVINPNQDIKGIAIFAHPISRKAKYFYADGVRISHYLNNGYRVILFDFNGFGESDYIDLYFWKDTAKVIEFAYANYPNENIVLHGISFGSFHCIRAIPTLPKNSKVVLENTNRSLLDYWKHWPHTAIAVKILQSKFVSPGFIRDMNVIDVFKDLDRSDIQYLFITCSDDKFTPRNEMEELAEYLRNEKSFLHTQNTKHLEAPTGAESEYKQAIFELVEA